MELKDVLSLLIAFGSMIAGVWAVVYVGRQVKQGAENTKAATEERVKEAAQRRREETMRFYMASVEAREHHETYLPGDREAEKIAALIESAPDDPAIDPAIRVYLSYLEILAIGVNEEVLDIGIVDLFAGGALIAVVTNYKKWIDQQRANLRSPTLYLELEKLAGKIQTRRFDPKHPYHGLTGDPEHPGQLTDAPTQNLSLGPLG